MDGDGWNMFGDAGAQRDHAGDVRGLCRLADTPENDFVDQGRVNAAASEKGLSRDAAKFVSAQAVQVRPHFAEGRSHAVDNNKPWEVHEFTSILAEGIAPEDGAGAKDATFSAITDPCDDFFGR
jgi:hypothetical protein